MRINPFIVQMNEINHYASEATRILVSHTDSKEYVHAAMELGRVLELATRLAAVCRLAGDALWEDSRVGQ